ncbi:hypothetical protein DICVIV_02243 [Dictyocaulus viviparus]|uniref:Uncharacterized protein n=1 Tax=Dictyocaulus viviparus TaxID=29172 RepID=A0A0D8Y4G3_DICVI|nr:hypothetical protein DICVIV_02243 [Dictyocaulus viviparus]
MPLLLPTKIESVYRVKWESHLRSYDLPLHAILHNKSNTVPLVVRSTRRKRCSCGCSGCDIFPDRACCSSECCSNAPLPLACCPPPPPPKPCCQPAYGPCCPATPNCCPNPCCRGKRPDFEEYEEDDEDENESELTGSDGSSGPGGTGGLGGPVHIKSMKPTTLNLSSN